MKDGNLCVKSSYKSITITIVVSYNNFMNTNSKIILFTGGHSTPAFAVLDEMLKDHPNWTYLWVSEKHNQRGTKALSAEYQTITKKYKIPFISIRAGKIQRSWTFGTFLMGVSELFNLFIGLVQSLFVILKRKPNIVISFGGFLAVPIAFWAWVFRIPVVTHEQTIVTGLANKIIAIFSKKIFISFESSRRFFDPTKVVFTGNPIRKDVFEIRSKITSTLDKNLPIIYITGGNQGAHEINKRIFEIISDLLQIANVIHQTGNSTITNDFINATNLQEDLPENLKQRYIVKDYVHADEIGEIFNKADVILSRAGANSVLEILALGKLTVFIPIPWTSHDEQTKNAQMVATETGLGLVLTQTDKLTPKDVLTALEKGLDCKGKSVGFNGESLDRCVEKGKSKVKLDAARNVVEEVYGL